MSSDTRAAIYSSIIRNWFLFGPIPVTLMLYIGASPLHISTVVSMLSLAKPIEWVVPRLMRRFTDRKRMFTWCSMLELAFLVAAGPLALIMPDDWQLLVFIACYLLTAICMSISMAYWTSLIGDVIPREEHGTYFGNRQMVSFLAGFIALIVGGAVLEWMGETIGFGLLYLSSAVLLVVRLFILRKYPNPPFVQSMETSLLRMMRKPLADHAFMKMTAFLAGFMFIMYFAAAQLSYILLRVLAIDPFWVTIASAIAVGMQTIASSVWGRLTKKHPIRTLFLWTLLALTIVWLLFAGLMVLPALFLIMVIQVVSGVGLGGWRLFPLLYRLNAPHTERPAYSGMFNALTGMAGFSGGLLGGFVYDQTESIWIQSIGIPVTTGLVLLILTGVAHYAIPHLNRLEKEQADGRKLLRFLSKMEKRSNRNLTRIENALTRMERRIDALQGQV